MAMNELSRRNILRALPQRARWLRSGFLRIEFKISTNPASDFTIDLYRLVFLLFVTSSGSLQSNRSYFGLPSFRRARIPLLREDRLP